MVFNSAHSEGPPRREGRPRYIPRRRVCTYCVEKAQTVDYKDAGKLRRYISDRGKIEPRRKSGLCARHQRYVAVAIKRARHLALLPYTQEHIRVTGMSGLRQVASAPPPST